MGLITLTMGLPLACNKENQEDKMPLLDTADTLKDTLLVFVEMVGGQLNPATGVKEGGITVNAVRPHSCAHRSPATASGWDDCLHWRAMTPHTAPIVFKPQGLLESLLAGLQRIALQMLIKPVFSPRFSIRFQRRWLQALARLTLPVPRSVSITPGTVGGVSGEWVRSRKVDAAVTPAGTLLYLHGGAYCIGSPVTHRALTARLALASGLPVFVLDYRLAPEHPYPAAMDDALAAFAALAADGPVTIGGDSAGGGLALAAALALRDAGGATPASLLLLSPLADAVMPDPVPTPPPGEAMLSVPWALACTGFYRGTHAFTEPGISPIRGDLRGLPPTLIQAGTDELLHDQALALHEALQSAGVTSRCEITQGRWHVFQLHGGVLKSADEAITRLVSFMHAHLPRAREGVPEHEVVILGAGMSGLCMAIQLQQAGIHNVVLLEKQAGLGGTWWDNTYPGAHVDVPAPAYSFSFAPNPRWTRRFASAPEIQTYMRELAERHGITARIRFNTQLSEASFDEATGQWTLTTGNAESMRSRFFVCSAGPLSQPRWPEIPGLDEFEGRRLHSARWDATCPLKGQRVAVIGTGSTASQIVPPVAAQAAHLQVFQRTANWVMPRIDRPYTAVDRWLAQSGLYNRMVRWSWVQVLEWGRRGFDEGTLARKGMLKTAAAHRLKQVPDEDLRTRLTPTYPLGCKRIIYSNDFYRALSQPHVELVTQGIERITPHGVQTIDGRERPVDVLICATGFDVAHMLSSIKVTGLHGQTLSARWQAGPEAYHGITVAGFPNFFLMLGPNTATGHTSTLLYIEPGVQHAIACMKAVRRGGQRWIDVRPDVMTTHNQRLQARLGGSVWSQCRSWYRLESGRVIALFPGFTREYVNAVKTVDLNDYTLG
ncbi:MAG: FAD-dependent oxidoreductase [Hydrogenophaga sp.]|nr:FAD-dependent oxidoreductase [Hydrogenophaga sp.]